MSVGDVYEIVDVQTLKGQQVLNVYTYLQFGAVVPVPPTPNIAAVLAVAFSEHDVFLNALGLQSTEVEHTAIKVRNLFDVSDQYDLIGSWLGENGTAGGIQTTFDAIGFLEGIDNGAVRPGHKRLAGIPDANADDGVITNAGELSTAAAYANAASTNIQAGSILPVDTWSPVVVKRVRSGTPGNYEYRFPNNSGELIFGTILEVAFNALLTSQVSRKIGRGA